MIIVFGSINMDLVLNPAHAPEAGETILLDSYKTFPGGKGANQAVAASRMGSQVKLAGCLGQDGFGEELLGHISGENVDASLTTRSPSTKSGMAIIIVEKSGANRIMVASGSNMEAKASQVPDALLTKGNSLLMQMEHDLEQIDKLAKLAHGRVDRVILNLAPAQPVSNETLSNIDILILNEIEIVQLGEYLGLSKEDPFETASIITQRFNLTCVVTLGAKGAIALSPDGQIYKASALPVDQVDSTGAGDAFCGTLTAALDQGQPFQTALSMACIAGSLACLKQGAMSSYPSLEEVQRYLLPPNLGPPLNLN